MDLVLFMILQYTVSLANILFHVKTRSQKMFKSLSENLGLGDLVESPESLEPSSMTMSSLTTANTNNHVTTNSSPSLIGSSSSPALNINLVPLINSESEHPDVEDEEIMKKSKFKSYRDDIISVLKSFDNTREWADLIKCLQKMKKVLIKNSSLPILPEKITVSKRLAQCLNPALPSGVHLKTLETFEEIFKLITVSIMNYFFQITHHIIREKDLPEIFTCIVLVCLLYFQVHLHKSRLVFKH